MQIEARYSASGESTRTDSMGMRQMQSRVFSSAAEQYILLKSPPASGKSRALMFTALEKLNKSHVHRVVVTVPERTIGASFRSQPLTQHGFHSDWLLLPEHDLCSAESEAGKTKRLEAFLTSGLGVLVCTHSTLRRVFQKLGAEVFDGCLVAIDEFHHVSSSDDSQLGLAVKALIKRGNAHIFAMTGSYFRGDSEPILTVEDEEKFKKITYNYYEQLDGYTHLKKIEIGMRFYRGTYLESIAEVYNPNRRTIIHIPSVNSGESTKEKHFEVASILDSIGEYIETNPDTGVIKLKSHASQSLLRVVDLVNDNPDDRYRSIQFLRGLSGGADVDLIIALGMAKEGFDWPGCEVAITVGYRSSMTELVQIIGRTTRDFPGKNIATFTNFVAEPLVAQDELSTGSNNIFKAIAASLLMEDVLAPKAGFLENRSKPVSVLLKDVRVKGFVPPVSDKVKEILDNDLVDLRAKVFQDERYAKASLGAIPAETLNTALTPKIIREFYPQLTNDEITSLSQAFLVTNALRDSATVEKDGGKFLKIGRSFVLVEDLDLDLIASVNPFQDAFEVISRELDTEVLREIQDLIRSSRSDLTRELADEIWPRVNEWFSRFGIEPQYDSADPQERLLADVLSHMRQRHRRIREPEASDDKG